LNIAKAIQEKVSSIVGDNGKNKKAMAAKLNVPFYSCFAHTFNLIVQKGPSNLKLSLGSDDEEEDDDSRPAIQSFATSTSILSTHLRRQTAATPNQEAESSTKSILKLIEKCKHLVTLFSHSNILTQQLLEAQTGDEVKKVVFIQGQ
jgi:hypothetical protein